MNILPVIRRVRPNERKRIFVVECDGRTLTFPYVKADPRPTRVHSDLAHRGFGYVLASGRRGRVHLDQVFEYNEDPHFLRDMLLYRLTLEAKRREAASALSRSEILRRLKTSPAQLSRILDASNYRSPSIRWSRCSRRSTAKSTSTCETRAPRPGADTIRLVPEASGARSNAVSDPCAGAARHWHLDPTVTFLNHGSFGACPIPVMKAQSALRLQLEREPVRFFLETAPALARRSREQLGAFIGADPDDLAFVPNATTAVNLVLRSLRFSPGEQVLSTNHGYRACLNATRYAAEREGAELTVVPVPFPLSGPERVLEAVLAAVTPRTRLAVLDHVTSPTGILFPIEALVSELQARGVDVLVDGAHALGMLPLDLTRLGAAYYTANAHKWLCAPKGAAFLHVRRDRQDRIRPLVVSHGASSPRTDVSRFRLEFDWTGTDDPTPHLCLPDCLSFLGTLTPDGIPGLMRRNHALAQEARALLAGLLGAPLPCPDSMLGSLATIPLPDAPSTPGAGYLEVDPLQQALWDRHRIEVPVVIWPKATTRWVRISAQAYNAREHYEKLGAALRELLA